MRAAKGESSRHGSWAEKQRTLTAVQSVGVVVARPPEVLRGSDSLGEPLPTVRVIVRGLRDSRTTVDRDTRVTVTLPVAQAAHLWRLLDTRLTDQEKTAGSAD